MHMGQGRDMKTDMGDVLRNSRFFRGVGEETLKAMAGGFRGRKYARKSTVFHSCDQESAVYFVVGGNVSTLSFTEEGLEYILQIHCPGDWIACESLFGKAEVEAGYAARAGENGAFLLSAHKDFLRSLLREKPDLLWAFSEYLCRTQADHIESIRCLKTTPQKERLAAGIRLLWRRFKHGGISLRDSRITHGQLGCFLDMSREGVTRNLKILKEEGRVVMEGRKILGIS